MTFSSKSPLQPSFSLAPKRLLTVDVIVNLRVWIIIAIPRGLESRGSDFLAGIRMGQVLCGGLHEGSHHTWLHAVKCISQSSNYHFFFDSIVGMHSPPSQAAENREEDVLDL